jgi:hypothetical protein
MIIGEARRLVRRRPGQERDVAESGEFFELIERCRQRCLWFTNPGSVPTDRATQIELLKLVERYGTRAEFVEAKRLREWLSQSCNAAFSGS